MKQEIAKLLQDVIKKNYEVNLEEIKLENPPKKNLWDYAFWCFVLSRDLKKNPAQISWEIAELLTWEELIESATPAWPYVNIKVNKNSFTQKFLGYIESGYPQGVALQNNKKTIYIDYIWANVWKPLHIGHMCTPNQGQVMINVYKKLGYNVISDSHIWDWGIIFGKLITAFKKYGSEEKLQENAVEHLFELYVKISSDAESDETLENAFREEFKNLSHWDKDSIELWSKFTKESILAMNIQLGRMNIKPDYNIGESFYEGLGLPKMEDYPDLWDHNMKDVVWELLEKWIASITKNDDGTESTWVVFADELKMPGCILQKKDGTHGYLASDLASIKYRKDNWDLEKIIYFVDGRQQLHLRQVFEISKQAWWLGDTQLIHAHNGFISLKDWAMSTRKWRIIKLEALLDEAESRAEKIILEKRDDITWEELKQLSKIIWVWAIKYGYLMKNRESDIVFDWDEFMSFEGNSWPYIQYAYVRARKILEKEAFEINKNLELKDVWFDTSEEIELAKKIMNFNNVLEECVVWNYPHVITGYAYDLTKAFSSFYNAVRVKDEENEEVKQLKLLLVNSFTETLKETFVLLGIEMPEKM